MVSFNTMRDEEVLQQGGGTFIGAFFSSIFLSIFTFGVYAFLVARNSGVMVTGQRIIIKEGGMLGATTHEVRLDNVQGVSTNGSTLEVSNAAGETFRLATGSSSELRTAINRAQS
jgi:hypothetical protein